MSCIADSGYQRHRLIGSNVTRFLQGRGYNLVCNISPGNWASVVFVGCLDKLLYSRCRL